MMRIEIEHNLSREEAIERIDRYLDQFSAPDLPAGVAIENPQKSWTGNVMQISFKVRKSFIKVEIKGKVEVFDDKVIIEIDLPSIVTSFVSQEKIEEAISRKAAALLMDGNN